MHHFQDKYPFLPKRRRLDSAEIACVSQVLKTKPNIKLIQQCIHKVYGKKITVKDIRNISAKLKRSSNTNDLERRLSILFSNAGLVVKLLIPLQQSGQMYLHFLRKKLTYITMIPCEEVYQETPKFWHCCEV